MTDKKIIKLFIDRDEAALGAVMKKYGELCLEIAEKHLPTPKTLLRPILIFR